MTILGIDYGTKRIGVALSDTSEVLAFPKETIQNNKKALEALKEICVKEKARLIVLGHSKDSQGNDNPVMEKIHPFKAELETTLAIPVIFEQESWSSVEATRFQGMNENIDASAAAIILQRFLDKQRETRK
ncbi:MAG: Holliday junction resolvase RuvX [Patescibacteria group bacterium]